MIVGDIHGEFGALNALMNIQRPDITIVCGDIAYYWMNTEAVREIKPKGKVYLIPGNHEDWNALQNVYRHNVDPLEIESNIFWCPIGSSIELNNIKILFVGGAESHDKNQRTFMIDWFPEEVLNSRDLDFIIDNNNKADIIISHTAPLAFKMNISGYSTDPTRHVLSILLEKYKPHRWYFGHFHMYVKGQYNNTKWTCLNYINQPSRYFEIIEL